MSEALPRNILLRCGGRTLQRYNVLAVAGAARGRAVPVPYTFARASTLAFRDQDGIGRKAAADKVAIEYPGELSGLVDQFGYRYCGPRLNGARTQLVTDPENFGLWTVQGVVARTGGQADPFGGTGAYLLDSNTPNAADAIWELGNFTGNGTKNILCFLKFDSATQSAISVHDATTGTQRHRVLVNWAGGVPTLAENSEGTGTLFTVIPWGGGWYIISINADSVIAANANRYYIHPDFTGAGNAVRAFGANAWNAPFPSSYQGPSGGASPSVADSLTLPFNFGPQDLTILARVARPVYADAVGDIVAIPRIFELGQAPGAGITGRIYGLFQSIARAIDFGTDMATTDRAASQSLPAGATLTMVGQFRSFGTGALVKLDVGPGFGAETLASAPGVTAWVDQVLRVGFNTGSDPLYGVLLDLIIARGLFSLNEMLAVA